MTGISKIFPNSPLFAKYHLRYLDENTTHRVDVLAGAFMLLRKEALNKTGGLDEAFFMYGEDIDLSYRIAQAGYFNYYLPEKILHYKGESTKKDLLYVKIFYDAMMIFFKKHYPHYSTFYSFLIRFGIYFARAISALNKLLLPKKGSINNEDNIVFNTRKKSYNEIITTMDACKNKKTRFWIYHPEVKLAITSEEVLTEKNIEEHGFIRE